MKSDNFENFDRYKNLVTDKLAEFVSNFENESERTKELIHYQTVINISREIIRFNDSEADKLKDSVLEYFDVIKSVDYSNDTYINNIHDKKKKSLSLYKEHLFSAGKYLIGKTELKPDVPLNLHLIFGIILDIIIYIFISKSLVPLVTIVIVIRALTVKFNRRKKGHIVAPYK